MNDAATITVGVPREHRPHERRVALVPDVVRRLLTRGVAVAVERGAGAAAQIPDDLYTAAGAQLVDDASHCDVVVRITPPSADEIGRLREGSVLIGFLAPHGNQETFAALEARGVTAFAMEAIPRISRAQSMDALSSQATLAGYKAVLVAADHATRLLPMMTTAAGTLPPARVLVLGAGVAGLQALATARRLGARATGYDVRPETAEQVRSVGADWLDLGIEAAGEGGYARELTESERAAQQQALTDAITTFDIVVTTALVPGRPAPRLVTAAAVAGMRAGSVVVDLAGETGGNCELSRPGEVAVEHDVTIDAPLNLPATVPEHASQLFARNVLALLELMLADGDGVPVLRPDLSDEVLAGACVARGQAVVAGAVA
jgi:NAD(P) transhydrogenase subunit alpha